MTDSYDAFVLCEARSAPLARRFLDSFLPRRRSVAVDFPFPELTDPPKMTFNDSEDVIRELESDQHESYALYWDSEGNGPISHAMLFFTRDCGMIAGIVTSEPDYAVTLRSVADVVGGQFGLVTFGNPPPDTCGEFIDLCRKATLPTLREGIIE